MKQSYQTYVIYSFVLIFFSSCSIFKIKELIYVYKPSNNYSRELFQPIPLNDSITKKTEALIGSFKIIEISKEKEGYSIKATSDFIYINGGYGVYTIVSPKSKTTNNPKIKIGREYRMTIYPFFKFNGFRMDYIFGVEVDGVGVVVRQPAGANVYTTPNLKGLEYIANP